MKRIIHRAAAIIATMCIAAFFTSTVLVELLGSHESIAMIKGLIVMPGLFILVPAIALTGGTGFALSKIRKGPLVKIKKRRMPFIAVNGFVILIPSAIFLEQRAASGLFDGRFYMVQGIELIAGAVNLTLMGLNMRDGLRLYGKLQTVKVGSDG